jgi:hypothetical protein
MSPHIRLFSHTISDGDTSMTIEGGSNFNNSDFPLYLMVGDTTWEMALDDAIAIARAAKFIARRVLYAHKHGELARAGAVFRRKLQGESGEPLVIELGLAEDGEVDTVYFHFDQKRLTIPIVPIGGVDQLFAAFESFGNAAADIIRASEPPPEPFWPT